MTLLDSSRWQGKIFSGRWRTADGGGTSTVREPAWAATPYTQRGAILRKAGDIWLANAAEIEDWSIREGGKIPPAAQFETHVATEEVIEAATLPGRPYGDLLPSEQPHLSFAERVPVGVISPFNFPQMRGDIAPYPF